jgi:3-polyprenyl-4-hydroxybenzoate decarboxylase
LQAIAGKLKIFTQVDCNTSTTSGSKFDFKIFTFSPCTLSKISEIFENVPKEILSGKQP